jgi:Metallopeptidase toxin 3
MEREDRKRYSDLYYWLMYVLPTLPDDKPEVWAAFSRYAGEMASISIMWGFTPTIKVDNSQMMECVDDGTPTPQKDGSFLQKRKIPWYGFTVPTKGVEEIYVASDLARGAGSTQVGPVLEATVLHELVHWCRKVVGKDVNDEGPPYAFEKEAYGKVMFRSWQSCMSLEYFKVK